MNMWGCSRWSRLLCVCHWACISTPTSYTPSFRVPSWCTGARKSTCTWRRCSASSPSSPSQHMYLVSISLLFHMCVLVSLTPQSDFKGHLISCSNHIRGVITRLSFGKLSHLFPSRNYKRKTLTTVIVSDMGLHDTQLLDNAATCCASEQVCRSWWLHPHLNMFKHLF